MKKSILLCVFSVTVIIAFAQKETFDLTTYTAPKGWKKQPAESAVLFSKEDATKGIYCLITLYKAVPGKTDSKENFDLAWETLVKEMVTVSAAPEMQAPVTENNWETQSGFAPFESDGTKGVVMLASSSSGSKMVNMIILTNTNEYEKEMTAFIKSVSLKKPETTIQQIQTPAPDNNNTPVIGTWGKTDSDNSNYRVMNGVMNYISRQYTFNANGTYTFVSKAYDPLMTNILLGKENGTYQVRDNTIMVNPQKSVLEAWSKNMGRDEWGKKINSQPVPLEKTSYQFTRHYFTGIQVWNLVLQAGKETKRDGYFSSNTTFSNAWYYAPLSFNNKAIELPK